jgi:DNA helicase HerA-like ATPase
MRVPLGSNAYLKRTENKDVPVVWDSRTAINPHVLVMGASGAGKTWNLRRMIQSMAQTADGPARIHVLDVHGDIDLAGASSVKLKRREIKKHRGAR